MGKVNRNGKAEIFSEVDYSKVRRELISPKHKLIFDIARFTGERMGAILQLDRDDVYEYSGNPRRMICFRARTRKAYQGVRKTRECPVSSALRESLLAYKPPEFGPLFPGLDPTKPIRFQTFDGAFRRATDRARLSHRGFSTHSFRRTLITRLSEKGVDLRTIQTITGHQDLKVLMGYIEPNEKRAMRAIELV